MFDSLAALFEGGRRPGVIGADYQAWTKAAEDHLDAESAALIALGAGVRVSVIVIGEGDGLARSLAGLNAQIGPKPEILRAAADGGDFAQRLAEAQGGVVAWLRAGDVLAPHALALGVAALQERPESPFVYADEDRLDPAGRRTAPYMKSAWSADLFLTQDYASRCALMRADAARAAPAPPAGLPAMGAVAWLLLQLAKAGPPAHTPFICLHRAADAREDAQDQAAHAAAVQAFLTAETAGAQLRLGEDRPHVVWPLPTTPPKVSLIVPTRDRVELLRGCVEGLRASTAYRDLEIIIADNDSEEPETLAYFEALRADSRVQVRRISGPFNFSRINNEAAAFSTGALIGLINNDIAVIEPGWLEEMARHAVRPGVGAVGARLLYGDGSLQHAGCVLGIGGVATHVYKGKPADHPGHGGQALHVRDVSAVTAACLLTPRPVWEQLAGLDAHFAVAYNDVDYCLRVREAGLRVIMTPFATLHHLESASRGDDKTGERKSRLALEKAKMTERWGESLLQDPFYSPNLSLAATDARLAIPPRRDLGLKSQARLAARPQRAASTP